MQKYFVGALLTVCLLLPAMARADIFDFSYSGVGVTASGRITADAATVPGEWLINGITGLRNGNVITFLPLGDPGFLADNLLIVPSDPGYLSATGQSGFVFETTDGKFNPYYAGTNGYYESQEPGSFNPGVAIDFNASAVPEPTSIIFMGTVLLGLAGAMKRKRA